MASAATQTVVLVGGFGGVERFDYWQLDRLHAAFPSARFLPVHPGPFSSHHDRACEIFYALVGGAVDYGEAHAAQHGHARFGRACAGMLAEWDAAHPIVLVGHSMGGITCRVLQQYLAEQRFATHPATAADWVCALISLSAPHNGDPVVISLGSRVPPPCVPAVDAAAALAPGASLVRLGSVGWAIGVLLHALCALGGAAWLVLEHWPFAPRAGGTARACAALASALANRSPLVSHKDNLAFECSERAMAAWNARLSTFPRTVYASFVAERPLGWALGARALPAGMRAALAGLAVVARALACALSRGAAVRRGSARGEPRRAGAAGRTVQAAAAGGEDGVCRLCADALAIAPTPSSREPRRAAAPPHGAAPAPPKLSHVPSDGLLRCSSQSHPKGAPAAWLGGTERGAHFASAADMRAAARALRVSAAAKASPAEGRPAACAPAARSLGRAAVPRGVWLVSKLCDCDHVGVFPFAKHPELPIAWFELIFAMLGSCAN